MKNYILFLLPLFLWAATSCDSYRNVSADDGVYYTENDNQSDQTRQSSSTGNTSVYDYSSGQKYTLNTQEDQQEDDQVARYEINYNDDHSTTNYNNYITDNPDDLLSYEDRSDRDVHVYIHYDNYWYWYRPRWYFRYYTPYASVIYYYGPAYYTYFYDPFWYDWDPWCDSWYTFNYYYYGYPYTTYYNSYYYGYPYGYPYVVNNYYFGGSHIRATRVRGPRGGRPADRISTLAGTRLASHLTQRNRETLRTRAQHTRGQIHREGIRQVAGDRHPRLENGRHTRNTTVRNPRTGISTNDRTRQVRTGGIRAISMPPIILYEVHARFVKPRPIAINTKTTGKSVRHARRVKRLRVRRLITEANIATVRRRPINVRINRAVRRVAPTDVLLHVLRTKQTVRPPIDAHNNRVRRPAVPIAGHKAAPRIAKAVQAAIPPMNVRPPGVRIRAASAVRRAATIIRAHGAVAIAPPRVHRGAAAERDTALPAIDANH